MTVIGARRVQATVLGIDAAWTLSQPSGVALALCDDDGWKLAAVAPSYQRFLMLADQGLAPEPKPSGRMPDIAALLQAAASVARASIDLIAVDMPLSKVPIVGRRRSDDAVSKAYGARKCGTHSPNAERPGKISDALRDQAQRAGYPLATRAIDMPALIEVYPHPALVELARAKERLPYKVQKVRAYWPTVAPLERRAKLMDQWSHILTLLETEISGVKRMLPLIDESASGAELKAFEDMLDAVVCAWTGICAIEGRAAAFGDDASAIWIPSGDGRQVPSASRK
ncbi:DUF429 domain-containing protein [Sinorhizobium glycinis]|uniref:DUF429 domain-containing protein n=1 Tax=Sinorhizobium glycinis TaxID=1472378 RepID=UPI001FCD6F33|nr:DUF429 domain-containing protein [Sinorhizobium glycinis]